MGWLPRLLRRFHPAKADASHQIIVNDELDYLVWPAGSSLPPNWRYLGKSGSEAELRAYVDEVLVETSPAPLVVQHGERDLNSP